MRRLACVLLIAACGGKPTPEKTAPAPTAPPPAAAVRPAERPLHMINVNGTRLIYRTSGDSGAPLVFVHGTLGDLNSWRGQEALFAQGYRVLVYSRRDHPPNAPVADSQAYSPKLHAEDLAALLLQLDMAPAHIVGSSYGAYVALALAREHPQLVRSVVLAEPPIYPLLFGTEAGDSARRAYYTNVLDPARAAFARGDSVGGLRIFVDGVTGQFGRFDHLTPAARAALLSYVFELRHEMLSNREQHFPPIPCAELSRITTPVLLLRGDRSPRRFQLISDELARCLQSDTTVMIPGASHNLNTDNPAYYNQVVARFLATH